MNFGFGKYKGQSIEEVSQSKEGENYCKWIAGQEGCPPEVYDFIVYTLGITV